MSIGIYTICCKDGVYIGQTTTLERRRKHHLHELRRGRHSSRALQDAWNTHGEASFTFALLEACAPDRLTEREQYWMDVFRPMLLNIAPNAGTTRGIKFTPDNRVFRGMEIKLSDGTTFISQPEFARHVGISQALVAKLLRDGMSPDAIVTRKKRKFSGWGNTREVILSNGIEFKSTTEFAKHVGYSPSSISMLRANGYTDDMIYERRKSNVG